MNDLNTSLDAASAALSGKHGLFTFKSCASSELRQPTSLFAELSKHPFTILAVQRYNEDICYILSPRAMRTSLEFTRGQARMLSVGLAQFPQDPPLDVIVRALPHSNASLRDFNVIVEGHEYTLTAPVHAPADMSARDAQQPLWRHHPEVAIAVLAAFSEVAQVAAPDGAHPPQENSP